MINAAIYIRVSSDRQEEGYSLEGQLTACEHYAQQHQMAAVARFQDVHTGSELSRPGLDKLRAMIRANEINAVIVYQSDRLTRSLAHALLLREELRAHGVELHYATRGVAGEGAEADLFANIETAFAEFERLRIAERMKRGKRTKAQSGKPVGSPEAPYGYQWKGNRRDKALAINEAEAVIVRQIFQWYTQEHLSINGITIRLSARTIPTPSDNGRRVIRKKKGYARWARSTVHRILSNEVYAGIFWHFRDKPQDSQIPVFVPALIDRQIFVAAQQRFKQNKEQAIRNAKHRYLLRNRIACACGYKMSGFSTIPKQQRYFYYTCNGKKTCTAPMIPEHLVNDAVWRWLSEIVTPERLRRGLEMKQQSSADRKADLERQMKTYQQEHTRLTNERQRMLNAYLAGAVSAEELRSHKDRTEQASASIAAAMKALEADLKAEEQLDIEGVIRRASDLAAMMHTLENDDDKRLVIEALDVRVVVEKPQADGSRYAVVSCLIDAEERIAMSKIVSTPSHSSGNQSTSVGPVRGSGGYPRRVHSRRAGCSGRTTPGRWQESTRQ